MNFVTSDTLFMEILVESTYCDKTVVIDNNTNWWPWTAPFCCNYFSFRVVGPGALLTRSDQELEDTERAYGIGSGSELTVPFLQTKRTDSRIRTHRWMTGDIILYWKLKPEDGITNTLVHYTLVD